VARARDRALYKRRGRCPWCGQPCQRARRHCARCLAWNRVYQRTRYDRLRQAGRCVQCANVDVERPYARCAACRAYMRERQRGATAVAP
jgi:hypothetical protein